ncbi:protein SEED AND ROOT HAIR PROTECTIVE PROTEIN-like [Carya illinoinensis]|uniref:protein SEED AND ROOT HAIR PROTECTIVE PROTEIN-like n=1 Tax=Carya illinoinensis TaxID=32201 RepID=UPI001C7263C2|nr:protein SEED AND ROOT HAIR PROTECTIVE PROTEIN-like [Carya illinoinensis]
MALTRFFMSSTSILLLSLLVIASATDYGYAPKPDYGQPKPQDHKPLPTEQLDYGKPKPQGNDKPRAVARITCKAVDEKGYEAIPFSILSDECDAKGYFLAPLSSSFLKESRNIKECKALLEHSPLETCKVPIDVNHGSTGAALSSFRILSNKQMKLFSVGLFFYTSEPRESSPQLPQTGFY